MDDIIGECTLLNIVSFVFIGWPENESKLNCICIQRQKVREFFFGSSLFSCRFLFSMIFLNTVSYSSLGTIQLTCGTVGRPGGRQSVTSKQFLFKKNIFKAAFGSKK